MTESARGQLGGLEAAPLKQQVSAPSLEGDDGQAIRLGLGCISEGWPVTGIAGRWCPIKPAALPLPTDSSGPTGRLQIQFNW